MVTATVDSTRTVRRVRARRRQGRAAEPRPGDPHTGAVVTVRPAPPLDPPFESSTPPPAGMELLPVDWSPADTARRKASATRRRPGTTTALAPTLRVAPLVQAPRSPSPLGTEFSARAALQRYIGMCVEVLNGYRPATHLRPVTDLLRYNDVADQLTRRTVRVRMSPGQAARHGHLVRVRRLVAGEPFDGIIEAAVVLEQGESSWAMAVRMERDRPGDSGGGWRCTVVQVV
jgi:hypothetical protein